MYEDVLLVQGACLLVIEFILLYWLFETLKEKDKNENNEKQARCPDVEGHKGELEKRVYSEERACAEHKDNEGKAQGDFSEV